MGKAMISNGKRHFSYGLSQINIVGGKGSLWILPCAYRDIGEPIMKALNIRQGSPL